MRIHINFSIDVDIETFKEWEDEYDPDSVTASDIRESVKRYFLDESVDALQCNLTAHGLDRDAVRRITVHSNSN